MVYDEVVAYGSWSLTTEVGAIRELTIVGFRPWPERTLPSTSAIFYWLRIRANLLTMIIR